MNPLSWLFLGTVGSMVVWTVACLAYGLGGWAWREIREEIGLVGFRSSAWTFCRNAAVVVFVLAVCQLGAAAFGFGLGFVLRFLLIVGAS